MSPIRFDAIVFDMDATLVDLGGFVDWSRAHKEIDKAYVELGCEPETVQEYSAKGLFPMLEHMYEHMQRELGEKRAYDIQQQIYGLLGAFEASGADSCTLMDGCLDVLEWLREENIPLGICTSNSLESAETALNQQGIRDYFKVVIGRTVDYPMKPDPSQLKICFEQLGADPKNGLMVGDSHKDVLAGKRLGAYTVGIPVYFTRVDLMKEAGVDVIIDSLAELRGVIEAL